MASKILIIGACGQIGSELTFKLREIYGNSNVIASDINYSNLDIVNSGPFDILDANDYHAIKLTVDKHKIDTVYLMAAMLSATGEKFPMKAWDLNTVSLFNVLRLAKEGYINKIFWPSSIAVFGPKTPKQNTPQFTVMEPTTVYGITKQVGERWCEYYFNNYNIDIRSIRYPGIISYKTMPGGGTTDYAVEIYHEAIARGKYTSFLDKGTALPMMYMEDAINATIDLMDANPDNLSIRSSYNVAGISFTPKEIADSIKDIIPDFKIAFQPDFRQKIADSWPQSIDDSVAREDWNWQHRFDLNDISKDMITNLRKIEALRTS